MPNNRKHSETASRCQVSDNRAAERLRRALLVGDDVALRSNEDILDDAERAYCRSGSPNAHDIVNQMRAWRGQKPLLPKVGEPAHVAQQPYVSGLGQALGGGLGRGLPDQQELDWKRLLFALPAQLDAVLKIDRWFTAYQPGADNIGVTLSPTAGFGALVEPPPPPVATPASKPADPAFDRALRPHRQLGGLRMPEGWS